MKYLLLFLFVPGIIYSQFDIRASMGINFISTPSLRDYINQSYRSPAEPEISTFNSAICFSGETNYYVSNSFAAGVEVAYVLNSFSYSNELGRRELIYSFIMPSLTSYYVISGEGYNFKLGGGAGVRLSYIEENFSIGSAEYNAIGVGFLLKADGNTLLDGNLYANIGTDLRYDLNGNFNVNRGAEQKIKLNAFSMSIRLGLTYFIL